jgi:type IV secretion system protein VirB10
MSEQQTLISKVKPKAVTLNKGMIIVAAAVAVGAIALAIISALQPQKATQQTGGLPTTQVAPTGPAAGVTGLPDYSDAQAIDRLLNRNQQPKVEYKESPQVSSELANLRQAQQRLMEQLAQMRQQGSSAPRPPTQQFDAASRQAASSAIFFPGGAPQRLPPVKAEEQKGAQQKTAANQRTPLSAFDRQNQQGAKLSFLEQQDKGGTMSEHQLEEPISPYEVMQSTFIPASLVTGINSDVPGEIVAQVTANVYDTATGKHLLIPQGSKIIGKYNSSISYGQNRVQAAFTRLIRPDGSSIVLSKPQGLEVTGQAGLTGKVNNHWWKILGAAVLTTVFSIPSVVAGQSTTRVIGTGNDATVVVEPPNPALQAAGQAVAQVGSQITSKTINIQPTITISPGTTFSIMVQKDVIIPPYKGQKA